MPVAWGGLWAIGLVDISLWGAYLKIKIIQGSRPKNRNCRIAGDPQTSISRVLNRPAPRMAAKVARGSFSDDSEHRPTLPGSRCDSVTGDEEEEL